MHRACLLRTAIFALATFTLAACGSDNADTAEQPVAQEDAGVQEETSVPTPDAASDDAEPEVDAAMDAAEEPSAEDAAEASTVAACKNEVDLSTQTLPCDCYGTIVNDVAEAMPSCTLTVVCCPGVKGLKCE